MKKLNKKDFLLKNYSYLSEDVIIKFIKNNWVALGNCKHVLFRRSINENKQEVIKYLLPHMTKNFLNDIFHTIKSEEIRYIILETNLINQNNIDNLFMETYGYDNIKSLLKYKPSKFVIILKIKYIWNINLIKLLLLSLDIKDCMFVLKDNINNWRLDVLYLFMELNNIMENIRTDQFLYRDLRQDVRILLIPYGLQFPVTLIRYSLLGIERIQWFWKKLLLIEFENIIKQKDYFENILFSCCLLKNKLSLDIIGEFYKFCNFNKILLKIF